LMTLRQKQKVAVLFTKMSTLTPKNVQPPAAGTPLDRATPKAENTSGSTGCIYPANLVSIAPRISEIWITQYFPIDLNVKIQPPPQGPPWADHPRTTSLVPVPGVCSTLSQNFTPIAPSCVEISSTVQTNKKNSKLNITPNATLYGEIKTVHAYVLMATATTSKLKQQISELGFLLCNTLSFRQCAVPVLIFDVLGLHARFCH